MSTKIALEEQRSRLERRANVIRSRLLRTLDALDTRRHQVTEIGHQAKRLAMPLGGALLGAIVVAAGTTMAIRSIMENRREQSLAYRFSKSLAPLVREPRPPFWQEAARKIAMAALTVVAAQAAKRGLAYLTAERPLALPEPQKPLPLALNAAPTP
jgi:hypothetical protein